MGIWHGTSREDAAAAKAEARILTGFGLIPLELLKDSEVTPFAKTVYAAIGMLSNWARRGDVRQSVIAETLGAAKDGVRHAIRDLNKRGWLSIERERRLGNSYVLHQSRGALGETDASREEYQRLAILLAEACGQPAAESVELPRGLTMEDQVMISAEEAATLTRAAGRVRVPARVPAASVSSRRA